MVAVSVDVGNPADEVSVADADGVSVFIGEVELAAGRAAVGVFVLVGVGEGVADSGRVPAENTSRPGSTRCESRYAPSQYILTPEEDETQTMMCSMGPVSCPVTSKVSKEYSGSRVRDGISVDAAPMNLDPA